MVKTCSLSLEAYEEIYIVETLSFCIIECITDLALLFLYFSMPNRQKGKKNLPLVLLSIYENNQEFTYYSLRL